jgi:hypothetical protein
MVIMSVDACDECMSASAGSDAGYLRFDDGAGRFSPVGLVSEHQDDRETSSHSPGWSTTGCADV